MISDAKTTCTITVSCCDDVNKACNAGIAFNDSLVIQQEETMAGNQLLMPAKLWEVVPAMTTITIIIEDVTKDFKCNKTAPPAFVLWLPFDHCFHAAISSCAPDAVAWKFLDSLAVQSHKHNEYKGPGLSSHFLLL